MLAFFVGHAPTVFHPGTLLPLVESELGEDVHGSSVGLRVAPPQVQAAITVRRMAKFATQNPCHQESFLQEAGRAWLFSMVDQAVCRSPVLAK